MSFLSLFTLVFIQNENWKNASCWCRWLMVMKPPRGRKNPWFPYGMDLFLHGSQVLFLALVPVKPLSTPCSMEYEYTRFNFAFQQKWFCTFGLNKIFYQPRKHIKKQRHYFVNKGPSSQGYGFSSSHVWMWELDYKESWVPKNWCFWTLVLEKTLESPLYCKKIQLVHPKGNQSWVFIGRTDVEAETATLWPPDVKSWLIWKDPDAGKDGGQEEKGTTENEMARWHHWLNGHGFE